MLKQCKKWIFIGSLFLFLALGIYIVTVLAQGPVYSQKTPPSVKEYESLHNDGKVTVGEANATSNEIRFLNGFTASQVEAELRKAADTLFLPEIFGDITIFTQNEMMISERHVVAQIQHQNQHAASCICYVFIVYFSVHCRITWEVQSISWQLQGTDCFSLNVRYFQPRAPKHITSLDAAAVQFYYHDGIIEVEPRTFEDVYLYKTEYIPGEFFWEDFIRLMHYHTTIRIWDMWMEGEKLYVDLHTAEGALFDFGSSGSYDRFLRLTKTLASIPGISSFEVLIGGTPAVMTSHANFDWVAIVEDGQIARFDPRNTLE